MEDSMSKDYKHSRNVKKKPLLTIKEKRAKKLEKRQHKHEHNVEGLEGHVTE